TCALPIYPKRSLHVLRQVVRNTVRQIFSEAARCRAIEANNRPTVQRQPQCPPARTEHDDRAAIRRGDEVRRRKVVKMCAVEPDQAARRTEPKVAIGRLCYPLN